MPGGGRNGDPDTQPERSPPPNPPAVPREDTPEELDVCHVWSTRTAGRRRAKSVDGASLPATAMVAESPLGSGAAPDRGAPVMTGVGAGVDSGKKSRKERCADVRIGVVINTPVPSSLENARTGPARCRHICGQDERADSVLCKITVRRMIFLA